MPQRRTPQVELWAVKEELNIARKIIDHYTHLVTKLYDELDTLRRGVCNECKTKFVFGAASSPSPGRSPSSPSPTESQPVLGSRKDEVIPDLCNAEPQTSFEPTLVSPLSIHPQTPADVVNIAESPESKPDEADWFVGYNPEVRQTLDIHLAYTLKMRSEVFCVKFSREGKHLAVGLVTGETYIYDIRTLSYRILRTVEYPPKKQSIICAMQFSSDDKYIATGADDGIRIWLLAERRVSPNGQFLLSSSIDGSVRIWCMRDGTSRKLSDPGIPAVISTAMSLDGRHVAAADSLFILRIWDFRSGRLLQRWKVDKHLWSVVFTSDGKGLLSGGDDKILRCWDISSLSASQSESRRLALASGSIDEGKECLSFHGHTGTIYSVSVFPDIPWVLSCSNCDSTARIWDIRTGVWRCTLSGHKAAVGTTDASPDGHLLATGARDCLVRIWRYEQAR